MGYKIAISKSGYNVLTATDPNDFIFNSDYNSLKIIAEGTFTQNVPAGTKTIYSFNHNLGYTPLVEGFCKVETEQYAVLSYCGMDIYRFPFYHFFYFIGADSSRIYFKIANADYTSRNYTIKYYIFEVPL